VLEDNPDFNLIDESFPHLGKKLKLFWGHPEFVALMDDLQHDKTRGQRKGFPIDILLALNSLDSEHSHAFPKLARKTDVWDL